LINLTDFRLRKRYLLAREPGDDGGAMARSAQNDGKVVEYRYAAPEDATRVLLVRHGASASVDPDEPIELVDGYGDPGLDEAGHREAELIADRLAGAGVDAIYASGLRRTVETAEPLARRLGLPVEPEPRLREARFGEWEGGVWRVLQMIDEQRWDIVPGCEPVHEFANRIRDALDEIAARHRGQQVAVFAHGGVIGQAMAETAGCQSFPFNASDNASITELVIDARRWRVRRFNDTAHLQVGAEKDAYAPT
jgi:probable phosphoglycerate mutase